MRLADTLDVPLRERHAMLLGAGDSPLYYETDFSTPEMASMRHAVECILLQQEAYPAFLVARHWDVLRANDAVARVNRFAMNGGPSKHTNLICQIFDPEDLRPAVANWEVAGELLGHLHREVRVFPTDEKGQALLQEALSYPDVPTYWRHRDLGKIPSPLLRTILRRGNSELRFFSTITTFATPHDVTLDELKIECCFPVDDATMKLCQTLAAHQYMPTRRYRH